MDRAARQVHADVVVVGARCAGAATALLLARAGLDVVMVDRAALPRDTTSTHALARGGVVLLQRWGLLEAVVDSGAPPVRTVSYFEHGDGRSDPVDLLRFPVKHKAGVSYLLAPRRYALDAVLAGAAVAAGARLETETTVTGVLRDRTGRVSGVTAHDSHGRALAISARLVVGADGLRSRVAEHVGAPLLQRHDPSGACFYAYVVGLDADGFEFHHAPRTFGGVFPTHGGEACVWLIRPSATSGALLGAGARREAAWSGALDEVLPELGARVRAGTVTSPVRGTVGLPNHVRAAAGPGWALVGDAGYHRDPITGHGITDAFRDAELLASAACHWLRDGGSEQDALARFAAERDRAIRDVFTLTRALARFPPPPRFLDLQSRLSRALDVEARALADRPPPARAGRVA